MVFSSLNFIYFFFPITILLYFLWNNRVYRNTVLLLASILFYSWGEPKLVLLMMLATFVAYIGGLFIERFRNKGQPTAQKVAFIVTTILLTGNLFFFKYFNFTLENFQALFGTKWAVPSIALPIGISFYTFQILSYVIDLHWNRVGVQKNFFYLMLYLCFFPQLIAGPIVRYQTVEKEIRNRSENLDEIAEGLRRFVVGFAKKVIIANNVAQVAEMVYAGDAAVYGTLLYWLAAIAYALQIYFDFSGYSDMAIGLGKMFGFHFLENFNYPYIATSITDFWRRWHISLSSWFRDYIYIPLGGNRVSRLRFILNILIVWSVTGFWHGAQWNFVLWGLYYGLLLLLEKLVLGKALEKLPKLLRWAYAMFFVLIGWVLFNLTDFTQMSFALQMMFKGVPTDWVGVISANSNILYALLFMPLGILCMFPWAKKFPKPQSAGLTLVYNVGALALFALCLVFIFSSTYNPFIYFRF
ncbi:MAG: MBOAT family protein [Clostridia bacterium]|nr:MBOAT family protein [Clostridia bacterium]